MLSDKYEPDDTVQFVQSTISCSSSEITKSEAFSNETDKTSNRRNWLWIPPQPSNPAFDYMPSLLVLFFLIIGICLDKYFEILSWRAWFNLGAVAILLWLGWIAMNRKRALVTSLFLFVSLVALGGLWHNCYWNIFSIDDFKTYCNNEPCPCILRGTILDAPRRIESPQGYSPLPEFDKTVFTMSATALRTGRKWVPVTGHVRVSVTGHFLGCHAGDEIEAIGHGSLPAQSASSKEFDYREFLRSQRVLTVFNADSPEALSKTTTNENQFSIRRWFGSYQELARKDLETRIGTQRQARLAGAFLLGNRSDLPEGMIQAFQETGTIHVLVVSGLHVMMLALLLYWILKIFPISQRIRLLIICGIVLFYVVLTGMHPSAVRAGVLCVIGTIAGLQSRKMLSFNVLAVSGIVVLALNPTSIFLSGTQLSFLTVGAIIVLTPCTQQIANKLCPQETTDVLGHRTKRSFGWRIIGNNCLLMIIMGTMIMAVISPLIATRFHVLSIFSIFLNLILWIPISLSSFTGMLTMILGIFDVFPPFNWLANLCGFICQGSLWVMEGIVQTVHSWRWSRFWVTGLNEYLLIAFYILLGLWTFFVYFREHLYQTISLLALWLTIISLLPIYNYFTRPRQMNVEFINVDHGLCTLIRLPDGKNLLYDAGKMVKPEIGVQVVSEYLWRRGITKIHGVILSHADADHYNMLPTLAERFAIDTVYLSPCMFEETDNPTLIKFKQFLDSSNVNTITVVRGDKLGHSDQYTIEFLHPGSCSVLDWTSPENANSLVTRLEYAGRHVLLTGDVVGLGIRNITMEDSPGFDILQAPHHGSYLSLNPEFIQWARAKYAVFSESKSYPQQRGRDIFERAGVSVIHTGQDGSAQFAIMKNGELKLTTE